MFILSSKLGKILYFSKNQLRGEILFENISGVQESAKDFHFEIIPNGLSTRVYKIQAPDEETRKKWITGNIFI